MEIEDLIEVWIKVQRLGSRVAIDMNKVNVKLGPRVQRIIESNASFADKQKRVKKAVKEVGADAVAVMEASLAEIGVFVQEGTVMALGPAASGIAPVVPTKKRIKDALGKVSADNTSVKTMLNQLGVRNTNSMTNILHRGFEEGLSNAAIGGLVKDVSAFTQRQAVTIARTATNAVSNHMLNEMYIKNSNVMDRVMVSAVLDHRTSEICMQMDGKIFPVKKGPRPPFHVNCRSYVVPVFKGETRAQALERNTPRTSVVPKSVEQLEKKGLTTKGGKTRKPNISKNKGDSPLYRKVSNASTYEEWLRSQPKAYQQSILGKKAGEAFRDGDSLSKVLSSRKSAATVKQLTRQANG